LSRRRGQCDHFFRRPLQATFQTRSHHSPVAFRPHHQDPFCPRLDFTASFGFDQAFKLISFCQQLALALSFSTYTVRKSCLPSLAAWIHSIISSPVFHSDSGAWTCPLIALFRVLREVFEPSKNTSRDCDWRCYEVGLAPVFHSGSGAWTCTP
jgi:hypothetical protein